MNNSETDISMVYGKELYRATETRIRQSLVENLVLWVFEKNTRARSFYEAVGYRLESGKQKEMRFAGATTAMEVPLSEAAERRDRFGDEVINRSRRLSKSSCGFPDRLYVLPNLS